MAGISFAGISSGLDSKGIIDQLMQVEANPQVLLKQKLSRQNIVLTAMQGLNARLSSLAASALALSKPGAWRTPVATSSAESVTVTTTSGAGAGTLSFDVTALAAKGSWTTATITDGATTGNQNFNITKGGVRTNYTAANGDANTLAAAINASSSTTGIDATVIRTGTDGAGRAQYRLLVTSATSGAANDITAVGGALPTPARLTTGADAAIRITAANGATTTLTSATNTFTDVLAGVNATVSALSTSGTPPIGRVTVTSAPDVTAVAKQAAGMVGALNVVLGEIRDQTKSAPGATGPLAGNSLLRGVSQQLSRAVSTAVPGASLADLGITITREGAVTIDEKAFAAYAAKNPQRAEALTTAFATAVAGVAKSASDTGTGTLSQSIASTADGNRTLTSRISGWDDRLALRRTALERQFSALEVALSRNQSTLKNLTGALAGLAA